MTLSDQIISLYPSVTQMDFVKAIVLQDDGDGPYIKEWNMAGLKQPTKEQLDAAPPAITEIEASVVEVVQKILDNFAMTRRYFGIISACTYANSTNPKFRAEGQYCVNMRDVYWGICYQILSDVLAGLRPIPTVEQVVKELPPLVWPT